jgi:formylglycine-generating enzyme required for sulfatase activity
MTISEKGLPLGTDVNGYRLESRLGDGGMATVYRATQTSLNRPVAIKVLRPDFAKKPDFVARFERESEALGQLQHPNLVSVIDRGVYEDYYYFVMELVEGSDLDKLLSEFEFDKAQIIQIVGEVGKGMDFVHERGVVHRDMKPANILISSSGVIKVSDFGIASIARGDAAYKPITGEGAAMGTGVYMAPEQMADAKNVDRRADIYALGATFYKLITRKLPAGKFAMPSELRDDISPAVDALIVKALDPDRDARPQTAREFCRDLIKALKQSGGAAARLAMMGRAGGKSVALNRLQQAGGDGTGALSVNGRRKARGKHEGGEALSLGMLVGAWALLFVISSGAILLAQASRRPEAPNLTTADRQRIEATVARLRHHESAAIKPLPPGAPGADNSASDSASAGSSPAPTALSLGAKPPEKLTSKANMITLGGGTVALGGGGDPSALPERRMELPLFQIDRHEVSNGDYSLFVDATGAQPPPHWGGPKPLDSIRNEPVQQIARAEAEAFARWVGKRLPAEEEWECAASNQSGSGQRTVYPWGDNFEDGRANLATGRLDNAISTGRDKTSQGVYHLGGNVAEWTSSNAPRPGGGGQMAVVRGGAALDFDEDRLPGEQAARATRRSLVDPKARLQGVGFRCARDVEGASDSQERG